MNSENARPSRDIIVIGGSEGGLAVLRTLLAGLPENLPACILIVLHTGPSSPRYLASILGAQCSLPVAYGIEGEAIRPGNVYLASPGTHLEVVARGNIHLSQGPKVNYSRPAADRLFQTAASVFGNRVISLILSGGDGDGTSGALAVTAAGGLNFVQDPDEAAVTGMPLHAIEKDHPSARIKSKDMASVLISAAMASRPQRFEPR
jgi:two-component system chemotaxis response regulator CheB